MAKIQFETTNQFLRRIMGNGLRYEVPRFQRDYSWNEEHWNELWKDITSQDSREQHYMGCLVFQSLDQNYFLVIDGQQRLATVSIMILAALYELQSLIQKGQHIDQNKERLEAMKNSFIGSTNPVTLSIQNKLVLNRNNNGYFKNYLCELKEPVVRNINQSNHLIRKALYWFRKKLSGKNGEQLAKFVERIADLLLFTTITVADDGNAYSIFETLNARGVQLSTPDLVKNYIFSLIDKDRDLPNSEIAYWDELWGEIIIQLGKHKFSDFIRVDWNSRYELARSKNLFQKIKSKITNVENSKEYLRNLLETSQIYSALRDENDEFWKNYKDGVYLCDNRFNLYLKTLNLFNVKAPLNALLAAFRHFSHSDFIRFLGFIETISVRYNFICDRPTGEQDRIYSKVARFITDTADVTLSGALPFLKNLYPSDKDFLASFSDKTLKTGGSDKKARYLLYRIERHLSENVRDFESLTLEHVLPKNYDSQWEKDFGEVNKMGGMVERIGNMALLSPKENRDLGNKDFSAKKALFEKSDFKVTQKCAEYGHWNEDSILSRQRWLGEQAKALWQIPNL